MEDWERFDNSDYDVNSPYYFKENKKVIGKMKDEMAGKPISEFVGLSSKMYAFKCAGKENKKCKGVKKNIVKRELCFDDYKDTLFNDDQKRCSMYCIQSRKLEVGTYMVDRTSLNCSDNKRYIEEDGVTTRAYR